MKAGDWPPDNQQIHLGAPPLGVGGFQTTGAVQDPEQVPVTERYDLGSLREVEKG